MFLKAIIAALAAGAGLTGLVATASAFDHDCAHRSAECYEKVHAPDVYATIERPVVVAPARREHVYEPALVLDRPHRVEVIPQAIVTQHVPAVYSTVVRSRLVRPAQAAYVYHPAIVGRVHRTVVTDPGSVRWSRTIGHDGRERLCKVHVAPTTRTVVRDVVVSPARRVAVMTPAIYHDVAVPVLVSPPRTRHIVAPAVYAVQNRPVVLKPAAVRIIDHPPVLGVERQRVRVSTGGHVWQRTDDHRW